MDRQTNEIRHNTLRAWVENSILAALSAAAGAFALWLTWYYYRDALSVPVIDRLGLIQPALMIVGGVMGLVAAALFALGHTAGRDVLKMALSMLPIILVLRLLMLIVRVVIYMVGWGFNNAGGLLDGTAFVDVRLSSWNIANIIVVVALVVYSIRRTSIQRTRRPGTRNDTR